MGNDGNQTTSSVAGGSPGSKFFDADLLINSTNFSKLKIVVRSVDERGAGGGGGRKPKSRDVRNRLHSANSRGHTQVKFQDTLLHIVYVET